MKSLLFGKKSKWMWLILALWLAALAAVIVLTATKAVNAGAKRIPVYSVETNERKLAITFDCAWGDETTDEVLAILKRNGVRATFFFVGTFAKSYPESVKKIYNAGHEIGNHSMAHADPTKQSYTQQLADMSECSDLLCSLTGAYPALYRAPSGAYNDDTVEAAETLGMTAVQWSADSIDWKDPSPQRITERILKNAAPGGILLFHLGKQNTADALEGIIRSLKEQGYSFCTVGELLLGNGAAVGADGVQRLPAPASE